MDKLFSIKDLVKILNVSESTIWRQVKANKIGYYKIGHLVRFSQSHVEEFLKGCNK